jgi:hypothetical protein
MPAKFHPVSPAVWDRSMRALSADAKLVRMYLLTCANRLSEGLFQIPVGIVAHDTGLPEEYVMLALEELAAAGLVMYDPDAEVVLDLTALRFVPLRNGRDKDGNPKPDARIAGAVRMLQGVPSTPLKRELFRMADEHSPDLASAISERFPELGTPSKQGPSTAPTRGHEGALAGSQGARREEPSRYEQSGAEKSRAEEQRAAQAVAAAMGVQVLESSAPADRAACGFCPDSVAPDSMGIFLQRHGRIWCGWCEVAA